MIGARRLERIARSDVRRERWDRSARGRDPDPAARWLRWRSSVLSARGSSSTTRDPSSSVIAARAKRGSASDAASIVQSPVMRKWAWSTRPSSSRKSWCLPRRSTARTRAPRSDRACAADNAATLRRMEELDALDGLSCRGRTQAADGALDLRKLWHSLSGEPRLTGLRVSAQLARVAASPQSVAGHSRSSSERVRGGATHVARRSRAQCWSSRSPSWSSGCAPGR